MIGALEKAGAGTQLPAWTLHDLRRTAASGMAGLGTAPHVIEACLNHKFGIIRGVASVYNRYSYQSRNAQRSTLGEENGQGNSANRSPTG